MIFHKNHLKEGTFKNHNLHETDDVLRKDLTSKTLSNYYVFFKTFTFEMFAFY